MIIRIISLILLSLIALTGCRKKLIPNTDDFTEYGWTVLENGNLEDAYNQFQDALTEDETNPDANNGLAWVFINMNEPDSALIYFNLGIFYATPNTAVHQELLAGRSFTNHVLGNYSSVILDGEALYLANANWGFSRDKTLTIEDIVLLLAMSQFVSNNFSQSLYWIQIIDPIFTASITTANGIASIATKIESLQLIYD